MTRDLDLEVLPARARRALRVLVPGMVVALLVVAASAALARSGVTGAPAEAQRTSALVLSGSSLPYRSGQLLAERLGWDARVHVVPGGGISRSTLDPTGSITAAARRALPAAGAAPDVVLVQGGEADHAAAPETLHYAASHLLDYALAHAPGAEVVLVGPIPGGAVPRSLHAVNDTLQEVARSRDVPYVDAVAAGWQAGDPALPELLAAALLGR